MKITCHSCQSKYTVSDEKVQGKTVKIKCRKCGTTILVNASGANGTSAGDSHSSSSGPAATAGGAPEAVSGASYLVNVNDGDQRTMSIAEIVEAYNTSVIDGETYVWTDGMSDWVPLSQVDAIVNALHAAQGEGASPSAEPPRAAAPPAEPSRPAAVKRDPGRRAHDLFGGSGGDDVATSAPLFSASSFSGSGLSGAPAQSSSSSGRSGGGAGLQQREENSVLFSLSALTAKAAPAPTASRTTARGEDSGIIDLKALAESGAAASSSPVSVAAALPDAGLFNLPAAPVPVAAPPIVLAPEAQQPAKSKTGLILGIMAILAASAIGGAFVFMNRTDDEKAREAAAAAATTQATQAATPAPLPVETSPRVSEEPAASASATATATAAAVAAKAPARGGGGKTAPKSGGDAPASQPAPAAEAKPPPPKKSPCGCAPGDLMCAMKCSTKK